MINPIEIELRIYPLFYFKDKGDLMQDTRKKILVIYLDDNDKQAIAYTDAINYSGDFITFETNQNKITLPSGRILKIKEDLEDE